MAVENKDRRSTGKLHWIDSAKGIGVLLVIVGHFLYYTDFGVVNRAIYSFHMPLFFILAGYVQKPRPKPDYIITKLKRLLIPFLLFSVIGIPLFGRDIIRKGGSVLDVALNCLYVKGAIANNPLWFLVVLFEVHLMNDVTGLSQKPTRFQAVVCVVLFVLGGVLYRFRKAPLLDLFGFNRAVLCAGFFTLGLMLKKTPVFDKTVLLWPSMIAWAAFGVLLNGKVSIYSYELGNYAFFLIAAVTGSVTLMMLCRRFLDHENRVARLSGYSIVFLGSQYFLRYAFKKGCGRLGITGTWKADIVMAVLIAAYVILLPLVYDSLKKRIPQIRYLNGEL